MRMCRSCTSLKFASTHTPLSGTIAISGVPGDDALADLHRALRDVARDRRRQCVTRVAQVRVADLRGGGLHVRVICDRGAGGQRAVRRAAAARAASSEACAAVHGVAGVRDFFRRHRAGLRHRQTAPQVVLRARQIRLALCDLRRVLVVVGVQAVRTWRTVCAELRLGLFERDPRVGRVQHDDRVAGLHDLRVVRVDRDDRAGHLRRDLHDVAVDVRVVGVFVISARRGSSTAPYAAPAISDTMPSSASTACACRARAVVGVRRGCWGVLIDVLRDSVRSAVVRVVRLMVRSCQFTRGSQRAGSARGNDGGDGACIAARPVVRRIDIAAAERLDASAICMVAAVHLQVGDRLFGLQRGSCRRSAPVSCCVRPAL